MKIKKVAVYKLKVKLTQPFRTAPGQHDDLTNILIGIELENGIQGFGEAAIATHITGETLEQTLKNLESISPQLIGRRASDYSLISANASPQLKGNACALAGLEMALLDAFTQTRKIPLWKLFGKKWHPLKTDMTVVIGTVDQAKESARKIFARGIRAFKIKIGRNQEEDFERVIAVKKIAERSEIYLDANQGFSAKETLRFLKRLSKARINPDLIEQPVPKHDWEGLKQVTREAKITVIADESVSSEEDARKLVKGKYAHGINIKLMKFGIFKAFEIAKLARKNGFKLMIGGMMETELGTTASAHLAAGMGGFDYVDLDSQFFLKEKVMNGSFVSPSGIYNLKKIKSGIGVRPCVNLFHD